MIREWYSMSKAFNGTDRLQLFGLEIIALISQGKSEYNGYIQGNERRKYGICNDNEGLLLVVALVLDMVSSK